MALKDFATAVVNTPPDPQTSGTSLTVNSGQGERLTEGFATLHPENTLPTLDTAEVVEVTNISDDTITIVREQKQTTAKEVASDWRITNGVYADDINNKAEEGHTHTEEDITDLGDYATDSDLTDHTSNNDIHREIDDNATGETDLWSADKISSELDDKADQSDLDSHTSANQAHGSNGDVAGMDDLEDFETSTQLDSRDDANRDRANHTGTQTMSTISDAGDLATKDEAGEGDIEDGSVTAPKLGGTRYYVVQHTFSNSTGTQTITGVPFRPTALTSISDMNSTAANIMSQGMACDGDSIEQHVTGTAASNTTSAESAFGRATGGGWNFRATVTSFNSDGITVNVNESSSSSQDRRYSIMFMA